MNLSAEELDLLRQAEARLHQLSPERLRVANDLLAYLQEREEHETTRQADTGEIVSFAAIRKKESLQVFENHQHWLEQFRDRAWSAHPDSTQIIRQLRESDGVDC